MHLLANVNLLGNSPAQWKYRRVQHAVFFNMYIYYMLVGYKILVCKTLTPNDGIDQR